MLSKAVVVLEGIVEIVIQSFFIHYCPLSNTNNSFHMHETGNGVLFLIEGDSKVERV